MIDIAINYELFILMLFVSVMVTGIANVIIGLVGIEIEPRSNYGAPELIRGLVGLIVCAIVVIW